MHDRAAILSHIKDALTAASPDLGPIDPDMSLLGHSAVLDSIGFVTFLVGLEERLGDAIDLAASFIEYGPTDSTDNPFRTVRTLADYVATQLSPPEQDHTA